MNNIKIMTNTERYLNDLNNKIDNSNDDYHRRNLEKELMGVLAFHREIESIRNSLHENYIKN